MQVMKLGMVLLSAAALTGCGVSLHPFYTAANLYDDKSFEGAWSDDESTWTVKHTGFAQYTIAFNEKGSEGAAADTKATLFQVNGQLFLDFQGVSSPFSDAIQPHGLFQLRKNADDEVEVSLLDTDRLEAANVDHLSLEGRFLMTARPDELQATVLQPQFFAEPHLLQRH